MPEKIITQTQIMNAVIDQMIAEKGLVLADEELENLRIALRAKMQEKIEEDMLNALSDTELLKLNELVERNASDEELDEFFQGLTIDFGEVAKRSMAKFREDYLNGKLEG